MIRTWCLVSIVNDKTLMVFGSLSIVFDMGAKVENSPNPTANLPQDTLRWNSLYESIFIRVPS